MSLTFSILCYSQLKWFIFYIDDQTKIGFYNLCLGGVLYSKILISIFVIIILWPSRNVFNNSQSPISPFLQAPRTRITNFRFFIRLFYKVSRLSCFSTARYSNFSCGGEVYVPLFLKYEYIFLYSLDLCHLYWIKNIDFIKYYVWEKFYIVMKLSCSMEFSQNIPWDLISQDNILLCRVVNYYLWPGLGAFLYKKVIKIRA